MCQCVNPRIELTPGERSVRAQVVKSQAIRLHAKLLVYPVVIERVSVGHCGDLIVIVLAIAYWIE